MKLTIFAYFSALIVLNSYLAFGQSQERVLWSFGGSASDGAQPFSSLIFDGEGNLYGTTSLGGSASVCPFVPCGTVFELSPNSQGGWTEAVLYYFCSEVVGRVCLDGSSPQVGLVIDPAGNLYGTTSTGGSSSCPYSNGCGTAFELSPPAVSGGAWTYSVLYTFCSDLENDKCMDGAWPYGQLVFDKSGNLYGTTVLGGPSNNYGGTVYELTPSSNGWQHTVLYSFCVVGQGAGCTDGTRPIAGVTFDKAGNLYGSTEFGGVKQKEGWGTLYELSPGAGAWTHKRLVALQGQAEFPLGTVSLDPSGNLYSTASDGGLESAGAVFRFNPRTHAISGFQFDGTNGKEPMSGVLLDQRNRVVYGTTSGGPGGGIGNVYKMDATWHETVLYTFCQQFNWPDGNQPSAGVIKDESGNLYGTTVYGGAYGQGTVFEITP